MATWQTHWSDEEGAERAEALFAEAYQRKPDGVWAAPGRINLIGEHTDYNQGLALPIALPHRTYVAVATRDDSTVELVTDVNSTPWVGDIDDIAPGQVTGWVAYSGGAAWALREHGIEVPGFSAAIVSCVPLEAGLSSSAAVECSVALALSDVAGADLGATDAGRQQLARLCVDVENYLAGAPTGGMDQSASLRASAGHALLFDASDGSVEHIGCDLTATGYQVLAINTRAPHTLSDGQYGKRRDESMAATTLLKVPSLRQVADELATDGTDPARLDTALTPLSDDVLSRRARHVVTEINRVRDFASALSSLDVAALGELMNLSHASLRDDFEVSCPELDVVVEAALANGAVGARMTGGGFGGSAIALVADESAEAVGRAVVAAALAAGHPRPEVHAVHASAPAERIR